ncbi:hypothetical protein FMUND_5511 [Fusarium mundagurra]|uniref:Uncharacterized protein n=1 Tax=Fusarium mundagurra TaxID=1567541 RepID=A0A8H5YT25_9HYPO|nr:hypothetical protein FMUND_5511 [Fusarium mundagurra]
MQESLHSLLIPSSFMPLLSSSKVFERANNTSFECSTEAIFVDTGIRIYPWETVLSEKIAKVAANIHRLLGEYRKEKFGDIKIYLVTCAFADAWRGMKPALYPKRLQEKQLFFPVSHKNLADATTDNEREGSETEPSIPTPERPQTNPMTRKHPANESLLETSPKQQRRQAITLRWGKGQLPEDATEASRHRFNSHPAASLLIRFTAPSQRPSLQHSGPLRTASKQKRRYKNVKQGIKQLYPAKAFMLGSDSYAGSTTFNIKKIVLQAEDP